MSATWLARTPIWLIVAAFSTATCAATLWGAHRLAPHGAAAGSERCPVANRSDARSVVSAFVQTAVERSRTGCSYALVSRRPADGLACSFDSLGKAFCYDRAHWVSGNIPVAPQLGPPAPFVVRFVTSSGELAIVGMRCRDEIQLETCKRFYRVELRS